MSKKRIFHKSLLNLLIIILTSVTLSAQDVKETVTKSQTKGGSLSEGQIAAIKEIRQNQINFRNAFRESLTGNQLDILTNPGFTREEKLKSFQASLSADQIRMIKTHRNEIKSQKYAIRATLSEQQRMGIRRMAMTKAQQNRASFQRVRLRNRHPGI